MPAFTPITLADMRALINAYIVNNNTNSITPAKIRALFQTVLDWVETELAGGGGGGGAANLQALLNAGNTATEGSGNTGKMILTDGTSGTVVSVGADQMLFTDVAGNTTKYAAGAWRYTSADGTKFHNFNSLGYTFADPTTNVSSGIGIGSVSSASTTAGISDSVQLKPTFLQFFRGNGSGYNLFTKLFMPTGISSGSPTGGSQEFYFPWKGNGAVETIACLSDIPASSGTVVAAGYLTGQTFVGNTTLVDYTVPADGTFLINAHAQVTAITGNFNMGIASTLPSGSGNNFVMLYPGQTTAITTPWVANYQSVTIRAKAGTHIQIIGSSSGTSNTYNAGGGIIKIA